MRNSTIIFISVLIGLAITLIAGFARATPHGLVGAAWFGFPEPWLIRMAVAPQYNPWMVRMQGFLLDFVTWFAVVGAIISAARMLSRRR